MTLRVGESVVVGDTVVRVVGTKGKRVQLACSAPRAVPIERAGGRYGDDAIERVGVRVGGRLDVTG